MRLNGLWSRSRKNCNLHDPVYAGLECIFCHKDGKTYEFGGGHIFV